MGLVDYASDESDDENSPSDGAATSKPTPVTKPAFQKVVDKSSSNKIRVNLPSLAAAQRTPALDDAEPLTKRPRLGAGGGFNSFLPAAKKPVANSGNGASSRGRGLGSGINLKTGSEAAFSREAMPPLQIAEVSEDTANLQTTAKDRDATGDGTPAAVAGSEQIKPKGKVTMFRPLSVARKPPKKQPTSVKPALERPIGATGTSNDDQVPNSAGPAPPSKPKVSFFSMETTDEEIGPAAAHASEYQPLLYGTEDEASTGVQSTTPHTLGTPADSQAQKSESNSLGAIADDLHLTASQRRQLFGRGSKNPGAGASATAINVVNFNTDAEYNANEELRAAGETPEQQHKAVRTVNASGRNSLRSLINSVASQGDALEDHFAKGKRNQREAGSKYGW